MFLFFFNEALVTVYFTLSFYSITCCIVAQYTYISSATIWNGHVFYVYVFECFILVRVGKLVVKAVCKFTHKQVLVSICQRSNASKALKGFISVFVPFHRTRSISIQQPSNNHPTTIQLPTNFQPTSNQLPSNYHPTSIQLLSNFHPTTIPLPTNFLLTTYQLPSQLLLTSIPSYIFPMPFICFHYAKYMLSLCYSYVIYMLFP